MLRTLRWTTALCVLFAALPAAASARSWPGFVDDVIEVGPGDMIVTQFSSTLNGASYQVQLTDGNCRRDGVVRQRVVTVALCPADEGPGAPTSYTVELISHYNGRRHRDTQRVLVVNTPSDPRLFVDFTDRSLSPVEGAKVNVPFSSTLAGTARFVLRRRGSSVVSRYQQPMTRGDNVARLGRLPAGFYSLKLLASAAGSRDTASMTFIVRSP